MGVNQNEIFTGDFTEGENPSEQLQKMDKDREETTKDLENHEIASRLMLMGDLLNKHRKDKKFDSLVYLHFLLSSELYVRLLAEAQGKLILEQANLPDQIENVAVLDSEIRESNNDTIS